MLEPIYAKREPSLSGRHHVPYRGKMKTVIMAPTCHRQVPIAVETAQAGERIFLIQGPHLLQTIKKV